MDPSKSSSRIPPAGQDPDYSWVQVFVGSSMVASAVIFTLVKVVDSNDKFPAVHTLTEAVFYAFAISFVVTLFVIPVRRRRSRGKIPSWMPSPITVFLVIMTMAIICVNAIKVEGGLQLIQESAFYVLVMIVLFGVLGRHWER